MRWLRDRDFFPGSQAMLIREPVAETAIAFIHGWGGSALGTWDEFPAFLRASAEAAQADVFFLNYASREQSVAACAGEVKEFLLDLLRSPAARVVNPSLPEGTAPRPESWRYSRFILVAHSMGAVVVRRALLDLDRTVLAAEEAKAIRLLFFAPAHLGSSLPRLIASGLGLDFLPGASLVGQWLRLYYRSLDDLEGGSNALRQLLADSRAARARREVKDKSDDDLRAFVLHARQDKVVVQDRFDEDLDLRQIAHHNHRSACKPSQQYSLPVDELRTLLPRALGLKRSAASDT
jgi:pimeloyl-ACP methyl ester carboxylesterase